MKNSLLILGIALVSFANVCNAKSFAGESISSFQGDVFSEIDGEKSIYGEINKVKPTLNEDSEDFNPETVIAFVGKTTKETIAEDDKIIENKDTDDYEFMFFEESMKEIIAQGDLITESTVSNEVSPLFYEKTPEDEIAELEIIIESTEANEVRPLDFKKINNNTAFKSLPKRFVGMD